MRKLLPIFQGIIDEDSLYLRFEVYEKDKPRGAVELTYPKAYLEKHNLFDEIEDVKNKLQFISIEDDNCQICERGCLDDYNGKEISAVWKWNKKIEEER